MGMRQHLSGTLAQGEIERLAMRGIVLQEDEREEWMCEYAQW